MEVFLAFSTEEELDLLMKTWDVWAQYEWAELAAIQIESSHKLFELRRRQVADSMAKGKFYILCDLGCVPEEGYLLPSPEPEDGLIGFRPGKGGIPTGIRIVQKGVVNRWPQISTPTYDKEHVVAMELAGKRVSICPDISFRHNLDS